MAGRLAVALAFSSLALASLALLWPARAAPTTSMAVSSPSGSVIDHIRDLRTPWGGVTLNRYRPFAQPGEEAEAWQPAGATSPPFERWASGGGIWEVVTRYGPGFKMVCTPEMVTPWKDAEHETKATFLADAEPSRTRRRLHRGLVGQCHVPVSRKSDRLSEEMARRRPRGVPHRDKYRDASGHRRARLVPRVSASGCTIPRPTVTGFHTLPIAFGSAAGTRGA